MEDANSEKQETMEEPVQDTSSLDEWTIINDEKEKLVVSPAVPVPEEIAGKAVEHHDTDKESSTVEEAREVIEEIDPTSLEPSSALQDDDSDGISVISESDKDEIEVKRDVAKIEETTDQLNPRFSLYMHFIAACCLAALVGFGIGCVVGNGKTAQQPTPPADIRMTNGRAIHPTVESPKSDVFGDTSVTIESEPYPPDVRDAFQEPLNELSDDLRQIKRVNDQNLNMKNFEKIRTFKDSLHKVKLSLDTLCSLIDKNHRANYGNICTKNSAIFDVIELKDTVEYIVNELGDVDDVSSKKFIENIGLKIENFASSFLDALSNIAENSMTKIDQKLVKMRTKLYQRLCLIRNTYANEAKIQEILDKRRISVENCEKMHFSDVNSQEKKHEQWKNQEKRNHERKKRNDDVKQLDSVYSEETMEIESLEAVSVERPDYNKNKRKGQRPEDFKAKKKYKDYKDNSSEDKDKNFESSEQYQKKQDKSDPKMNKKYNSNYNSNKNDREFRDYNKNSGERSNEKSEEKSDEEMNFNFNNENKENKYHWKNDEKMKKKYNKRRDSREDSSNEHFDFDSAEADRNQRNPHKSSKKYGSPKGEPKENFVEKNQGNYNENNNNNNNDNACHSKKCPKDNDEKNNRKNGKNGQWQFERAQGRNKYRSSEEEGVWYNDRAKARERSRLGF